MIITLKADNLNVGELQQHLKNNETINKQGYVFQLIHIRDIGVMQVQERKRRGAKVPKYIVIDNRTDKVVEEFRRKTAAIRWATQNQNG